MKNLQKVVVMVCAVRALCAYEVIEDLNELKISSPTFKEVKTLKIRLDNGLEALLISDPNATSSAAALSVETGSWHDPAEYPGMAHFCEHMLFMGSEKYPDESAIQKAVLDNGGQLNAYTKSDRTVYMFSNNHNTFNATFDIFAQFFISPLFKEDAVKRELNAVDQEFSKNLEHDGWRAFMVFKETGNPDHPNRKFSTGNASTLSVIPLEALKNWYRLHYSAHQMHLIVYANQELDALAHLVNKSLSQVPVASTPKLPYDRLTSSEQLGAITYITPIRELRTVTLNWEIPTHLYEDLEAKPSSLIAYNLSYQGEKSLYSLLKEKGYLEELHASTDPMSKNSALLSLELSLTKQGIEELDDVLKICFASINTLKMRSVPSHLFSEYRKMKQLDYEWQSRVSPFQFVMNAADAMIEESLATFPSKLVTLHTYKPKALQDLLSLMTPENAMITVLADPKYTKQKHDRKEKWQGAEYTIVKLDQEKLALWSKPSSEHDLLATKPNSFIPSKLSLISREQLPLSFEPTLLANNPQGKCFFAQDHFYLIPEVAIQLGVKSPLISSEAKNIVMTDLFLVSLENRLSSLLSEGQRAGLSARFSQGPFKIKLAIQGYQDKIDLFTKRIFDEMVHLSVNEQEFNRFKDTLLADYENGESNLAFFQANELLGSLLYNNVLTSQELAETLAPLTFEEFSSFCEDLFEKVYLEGFVTGNLTETDGAKLWNSLKEGHSFTPFLPENHYKRKVLHLPDGATPFTITKHSDRLGNATSLMLQMGEFSFAKLSALDLLSPVMSESFFRTLRSVQQTGYIVKAWSSEDDRELSLNLAVHSVTHSPEELLGRFELFLEEFDKGLEQNITKERFLALKEARILHYQKPFDNLYDYSAHMNFFAFQKEENFTRRQKLIEAIQNLSYEDFTKEIHALITRQNTKRVAIFVVGTGKTENALIFKPSTKEFLKALQI